MLVNLKTMGQTDGRFLIGIRFWFFTFAILMHKIQKQVD